MFNIVKLFGGKKDNSDVMLYGRKELTRQTFMFGAMASVFFVIWLIMYTRCQKVLNTTKKQLKMC